MDSINILQPVAKTGESKELDKILWEVLWKPFGLPRNVRDSFKLEGECIELVAKQDSVIVGGLVSNYLSPNEFELRHIAIKSGFQKKSIGSMLVRELIKIATQKGCSVIQAYARNTSADFFLKQGFVSSTGKVLEHSLFSKHGITFKQMHYDVPQDQA